MAVTPEQKSAYEAEWSRVKRTYFDAAVLVANQVSLKQRGVSIRRCDLSAAVRAFDAASAEFSAFPTRAEEWLAATSSSPGSPSPLPVAGARVQRLEQAAADAVPPVDQRTCPAANVASRTGLQD